MFSVWPELFAYELIAVTLLRVVAAYTFLMLGVRLLRVLRRSDSGAGWRTTFGYTYAAVQVVVGTLLGAGLYTQPAALVGIVLSLLPWGGKQESRSCEQHLQLVLLATCVALLIMGPGLFAVDLPI